VAEQGLGCAERNHANAVLQVALHSEKNRFNSVRYTRLHRANPFFLPGR
jgi:hypothetical protein